jgi:hypothetical protein
LPIVTSLNASDYLAADVSAGQNARAISVTNFLAQVSEDTIGSGGAALTTGKIPKAIAASPWLADSILVEDTSKIGVGGTPLLKFDVLGSNAKTTTAAVEYLGSFRSTDTADPLRLRFGITTHATGGSRSASVEVDDAGTKRNLLLQPAGGLVAIGAVTPDSTLTLLEPGAAASSAALRLHGDGWVNIENPFGVGLGWNIYHNGTDRVARITGPGGDFFFDSSGNLSVRTFVSTAGGSAVSLSTRLQVSNLGNVGLGTTTFGSGAVKVFALGNGTAPAAVANQFQMWSEDIVAGNAAPHFITELGNIIKLYRQAHIVNADGTLGDITTKYNTLLGYLRNLGLLATS